MVGERTKVKYQEASLQSSSIANSFKGERKGNQGRKTFISVSLKRNVYHTYIPKCRKNTYSAMEGVQMLWSSDKIN